MSDFLTNLLYLGIATIVTILIMFLIQIIQTVLIYRKIIKVYNNTITMQDLWKKTIEELNKDDLDDNFIKEQSEKLNNLNKLIKGEKNGKK